MVKGRTIAIANQKGGVGKTTTALALSSCLAAEGARVLAVDLDPQANLTQACGIRIAEGGAIPLEKVMAYAITGEEAYGAKSITRCDQAAFDVMGCTREMAALETALRSEPGGERILAGILEPIQSEYDYIVVDTTPYLGALTVNALVAADEVIIPVNPQMWAATGLAALIRTIGKVRARLTPELEITGIIMTMVDERTRLYRETEQMIRDFVKDQIRVFDTKIPVTVKVGEAALYGDVICCGTAGGKAAEAYRAFAKEVEGNGQKKRCNDGHSW